MVTAADVLHSSTGVSTFVRSQGDALIGVGWGVRFGIVRNRTSMVSVARDIRRLRCKLGHSDPAIDLCE